MTQFLSRDSIQAAVKRPNAGIVSPGLARCGRYVTR